MLIYYSVLLILGCSVCGSVFTCLVQYCLKQVFAEVTSDHVCECSLTGLNTIIKVQPNVSNVT